MSKKSICTECLYGSQPYGYYPIVCVFDEKHIKEMRYDRHKCRHFEQAPDPPPTPHQTPFQSFRTKDYVRDRIMFENRSNKPTNAVLGYAMSAYFLDWKGVDTEAEMGGFKFKMEKTIYGIMIKIYD